MNFASKPLQHRPKKRLNALSSLFPKNNEYLNALCQNVLDTGSASWHRLSNKIPDSTFAFRGARYTFPGSIIKVSDSQSWERAEGVKNKAAQYEDDSGGMVAGVLYLGHGDKSIAMIGSKTIFPSSPPVKYLDGTLSTHAVEVIPLTSLKDRLIRIAFLYLNLLTSALDKCYFVASSPRSMRWGSFLLLRRSCR